MFVLFEWIECNVIYVISDLVSDLDFFEELVFVIYNQDKFLLLLFLLVVVNLEEFNIVDNNLMEIEIDIVVLDFMDVLVIILIFIEVFEEVVDENVEFVVVEEMLVFCNGNVDLMRYLSENIKYFIVSVEQGV